jgi:hypothetical protein
MTALTCIKRLFAADDCADNQLLVQNARSFSKIDLFIATTTTAIRTQPANPEQASFPTEHRNSRKL